MKRSITAACLLGSLAALSATPADAAVRHYVEPELCTPFGYNFAYAPHGFDVCATTTADYRSKARHGKVKVSGTGTTDYVFDAGVYEIDGSFSYSYRFKTRKGDPSTVVVRESKDYQVATAVICTVAVDLTFTDGVLTSATPSNFCPDSDGG